MHLFFAHVKISRHCRKSTILSAMIEHYLRINGSMGFLNCMTTVFQPLTKPNLEEFLRKRFEQYRIENCGKQY